MQECELQPGLGILEAREMIQRQLRSLVVDPDDLEDITQECLIRAWVHRDSFRDEAKYTTWLFRLVQNAFLTWLRGCEARRRNTRRWASQRWWPITCDISEAVVERVCAAQLLAKLGATDRSVLELMFVHGLPSAEVGHRLGLAPSSVRCRIMRLKGRLWLESTSEYRTECSGPRLGVFELPRFALDRREQRIHTPETVGPKGLPKGLVNCSVQRVFLFPIALC